MRSRLETSLYKWSVNNLQVGLQVSSVACIRSSVQSIFPRAYPTQGRRGSQSKRQATVSTGHQSTAELLVPHKVLALIHRAYYAQIIFTLHP